MGEIVPVSSQKIDGQIFHFHVHRAGKTVVFDVMILVESQEARWRVIIMRDDVQEIVSHHEHTGVPMTLGDIARASLDAWLNNRGSGGSSNLAEPAAPPGSA